MTDRRDPRIADYVLGLMEPGDSEAFERILERDAVLAEEVASGQARLHDLDATAEPLNPGTGLWERIEQSLGEARRIDRTASRRWVGIWESLRFWRIAGLAGVAASLVLAVGLAGIALRPEPAPQYVAILVPADGSAAGAIVEVDRNGQAQLIPLRDIAVPNGRALEVWTLPSAERGPVSIGLTGRATSLQLAVDSLPPTNADQLFEITLEPETGSPIGRPTGPVLFVGRTVRTP